MYQVGNYHSTAKARCQEKKQGRRAFLLSCHPEERLWRAQLGGRAFGAKQSCGLFRDNKPTETPASLEKRGRCGIRRRISCSEALFSPFRFLLFDISKCMRSPPRDCSTEITCSRSKEITVCALRFVLFLLTRRSALHGVSRFTSSATSRQRFTRPKGALHLSR